MVVRARRMLAAGNVVRCNRAGKPGSFVRPPDAHLSANQRLRSHCCRNIQPGAAAPRQQTRVVSRTGLSANSGNWAACNRHVRAGARSPLGMQRAGGGGVEGWEDAGWRAHSYSRE